MRHSKIHIKDENGCLRSNDQELSERQAQQPISATQHQAPPIKIARQCRTRVEFAIQNLSWFASVTSPIGEIAVSDGFHVNTTRIQIFTTLPIDVFGSERCHAVSVDDGAFSSEEMKAHCCANESFGLAGVCARLDNIDVHKRWRGMQTPRCCPGPDFNLLSSKVIFKLICSPICDNYTEDIDGATNGAATNMSGLFSAPSKTQLANLSSRSKVKPANVPASETEALREPSETNRVFQTNWDTPGGTVLNLGTIAFMSHPFILFLSVLFLGVPTGAVVLGRNPSIIFLLAGLAIASWIAISFARAFVDYTSLL